MRHDVSQAERDGYPKQAASASIWPAAVNNKCHRSVLALIPIWDYLIDMRVIAVSTLKAFWEQPEYRDAEQPLRAWLDEVRNAAWKAPAEIKAQFKSASILKRRRVVFNIKGNDYRVVVAVAFVFGAVYIKFVGTHEQYDRISAETVELKL
jgi:mRNA interferase HigB